MHAVKLRLFLSVIDFISAPLSPNLPMLNVSNIKKDDDEGPRAWWFSKEDDTFSSQDVTNLANGFENSLEYVKTILRTRVINIFSLFLNSLKNREKISNRHHLGCFSPFP